MSKPGVDPSSEISSGDVLRPTERHPAYRRRETQSGSCTERENLDGDAKGKGASGSDLTFNPDEYLELTIEKLIEVLNAKTKVIRTVRANAQPIIMPAASAPASTKALAIPPDELQRRAGVIASNASFQSRIGEALSKRFADKEPAAYVEQRIYDGFPSDEDNVLMEKFHLASWPDRQSVIGKIKDERVVEFSRRLIYSDQPAILIEADATKLKTWASNRVMTTDGVPWMTVPKALVELEELTEQADEKQKELLAEVKTYIDGISAKFG